MADDSAVQESPYTSPSIMGSIPIDRLAQDAVPDYGVDTAKMKSDLTDVARQKVAATDTAVDRQLAAQKGNYSKLEEKLAGVGPLNAQPWDADKEKADRVRSPLEAFGSTAGIFAMIASAFTKTPLDNALNAGAAAINGARADDFDGYDKAHTAWKENTDLAIKNHEIERQAFKDAEELYKQDPVAGGAELKAVAARFGAKAELAMIDSGYVDKVFEIQKSKSEAAQKLFQQLPQLAELDEKTRVKMLSDRAIKEENIARSSLGKPPLSAQESAQIIGDIKRSATQSFGTFSGSKMDELALERRASEIMKENPQMQIWDARIQAKQEMKDALTAPGAREKLASIERAKSEWLASHPEANGVIPASVENEIRMKASGTFTSAKQESMAIQNRAEEISQEAASRGENVSPAQAYARAAREVGQEKAHLTAGQADKIKQHIHLLDESARVIERVEGTIEKYVGAAGIAGKPLRLKERVSNMLGGNQTDRVQMQRDIEYLRLNAPRLLTDSPGRPLAADVKRIDTIVAGLELGDTGANTLRAMEEIKGILHRSKESATARLNNTWSAPGAAAPHAGSGNAPPARGNPWESDPVIK